MLYLNEFRLPTRQQEETFFNSSEPKVKRTCYTSKYPFGIFRYREMVPFEFEQITILYGGNGSGKSTILNVIAEKLQIKRGTVYNRSDFFEDYLNLCEYQTRLHRAVPADSRIVTSDDVFDYLLDVRCINGGIDTTRAKLLNQYVTDRKEHYQLKSLDDYEEWRRRADSKSKSQSQFLREHLMKNVDERSNGESALSFFADSVKENALYLLDEPENSLSAERQMELKKFIEDSARYFHCQFIISTHSPFLLAMNGAKIYDLDSIPPCPKVWTQLKNVRTYYDFFCSHFKEFEKEL